jgi:outer membrane autotransporter protein
MRIRVSFFDLPHLLVAAAATAALFLPTMVDAACPAAGNGITATGSGTTIAESNCTITTSTGSRPGVTSTAGASVTLDDSTINTTGAASHGIAIGGGGSVALGGVTLTTTNANAAGVLFQSGGGQVSVTGSTITAGGNGFQAGTGASGSVAIGSDTTVNAVNGLSVTGAGSGTAFTGNGLVDFNASAIGMDLNTGAVLSGTSGVTWNVGSVNEGIRAQAGSVVDLDGAATISSTNSRGVYVGSGAEVRLDATGNTVTSSAANQAGVFLTGTGSQARFGQVTVTSSGAGAAAVQLSTGNTIDLGRNSIVRALGTGAGITAGNTNTITAADLAINTTTGTALNTGAGTVANLSGTTTINTQGAGIVAAGAGAVTSAGTSGRFLITSTGSGAGAQASSGARLELGAGSSIRTETGTGLNIAAGSTGVATDLTVVTNTSQQNLLPILTALPEYPLLGGFDPIDLDHVGDPLGLQAYAIASPAAGVVVGGGLTLGGVTSITAGSYGMRVAGAAANAVLNGSLDILSGPGGTANTWAHGVEVNSGTFVLNGNATVSVDSVAGSGFDTTGTASASITVNGGVVVDLINPTNLGINNINEAAALYSTTGTIRVTGAADLEASQGRGYGLWAGADPSAAIFVGGNTAIATHGREAFGVRLDNGTIDLGGDLSIVTGVDPSSIDALAGAASPGLRAIAGTMSVAGTTNVTTVGGIAAVGSSAQTRESAYGLWNTSYSRLQGNGGALSFEGPTSIRTSGAAAHGVYNDSVAGSFDFDGPVFINTTGGLGSVTWQRTFNSILSTIRNETVGAWGVNNAISGTTRFHGLLGISTTGEGAGGIRSTGGTVITDGTTIISTSGANAYGLYGSGAVAGATTYSGVIDANGFIDIETTGVGSHAIFADQGGAVDMSGGARLRVADAASKGILATGNSTVTGTGRYDIVADLQSAGNSAIDLTFDPGSVFVGATTATGTSTFDLTLVDSLWTLTASSNLSTLVNDPSLIDFVAPTGDPLLLSSYKSLTVNNYVGVDGNIALNTYLGDDASPSDRLIIDGGSATGTSGLIIKNTTGAGALTTGNGILVVDTANGGATDPGAFHLYAPVAAGPYDYLLYRSSLDGSGTESWYLRSELVGPPHPTPIYRPEVSLYAAVPSMAAIYGRHIIDTLHERVGEEEQLRGRMDIGEDESFNGVWLRGIGHWGHREGDARGVYDGAPEFDYRFGAMQGGIDFYREEKGGVTDHAGMYLAYGQGVMDVTQNLVTMTRDAGHNDFGAFSVGGYWTRFGEEGWYLDGVLQGTWYDMTTHSNRATEIGFPDQDIDGFGFAASLEGGYPFDLGEGWQLEPQAQIIWQTIHMDGFNDGAAEVRYDNLNSLAGRIGARVARTWEAEEATATEPARLATVWGRVNLWHEFTAKAQTDISSADGFVPFSTELDETWIEIGVGATRQISQNTSVYGNLNFSTTFDGDNYAWNGKVGLTGRRTSVPHALAWRTRSSFGVSRSLERLMARTSRWYFSVRCISDGMDIMANWRQRSTLGLRHAFRYP